MNFRERSIMLDPGAPLATAVEPGLMLVGVYRCEQTDLLYVRVRVGGFTFDLDNDKPLKDRHEAVAFARDFIKALSFQGRVKWQLGGAGAVTNDPKL